MRTGGAETWKQILQAALCGRNLYVLLQGGLNHQCKEGPETKDGGTGIKLVKWFALNFKWDLFH